MTNTIALKYPVTIDGNVINSLTIRRAKTRDFVAVDAVEGEFKKTVALLASITDQPIDTIYELDQDDFRALSEAAGTFLGESQETAPGARQ